MMKVEFDPLSKSIYAVNDKGSKDLVTEQACLAVVMLTLVSGHQVVELEPGVYWEILVRKVS